MPDCVECGRGFTPPPLPAGVSGFGKWDQALCEAHYRVKEIERVCPVTDSPWNEQGTTGKQEWRMMAVAALTAARGSDSDDD